jgi:hypothetical protein
LSDQHALATFEIDDVRVEERTHFDDFGGPRNHDLLVIGKAGGETVVVAIEAKAGEPFDRTIAEYRDAAMGQRERGEATNKPERLDQLLATYAPALDPKSEEVGALRYQLFSALAGTVVAASEHKAQHAVLMIHEFKTDDREGADNDADLARFSSAVLGVEMPADHEPWCVEVESPRPGTRLYLAKAVSDFRSEP